MKRTLRKLLQWITVDEPKIIRTTESQDLRSSRVFELLEAENGYILQFRNFRDDVTKHYVCRKGDDVGEFIISTMATVRLIHDERPF